MTQVAHPQHGAVPVKTGRPMAAGPTLVGIGVLAGAAAILRATQPLLRGPDPFWHWDVGRRIVGAGALLREDPYSFLTVGREWTLNQWGAELVFGIVEGLGGLWLLAAFVSVLAGGIVLLVGWSMWRAAPSLVALPVLGVALFSISHNWHLRGGLFTLLLVPLLFRELRRREGGRPLVIGALIALWANLHGGFLLGIAMVVGHEAGRWLVAPSQDRSGIGRRAAMTSLGAVAGALLTPYGPRYIVDGLRLSQRAAAIGITEWSPTPILELAFIPFTILGGIALVALAVAATREDLPVVVVIVGAFILGVSAVRHVATASALIAIASMPFVVAAVDQVRGRRDRAAGNVARVDRLATIVVVTGALFTVAVLTPRSATAHGHAADVPLDIAGAMASRAEIHRVVADTAWAPALATLGGPNTLIAVDGRVELFTDDEYDAYDMLLSADPGWRDILNEWCVSDIVIESDSTLDQVLRTTTTSFSLESTETIDPVQETTAVWWSRDAPCAGNGAGGS